MEGINGGIEKDISEAESLAKVVKKKLEVCRIMLTAVLFILISSAILVVSKLFRIVPLWKPVVFMALGFICLLIINKIHKEIVRLNKKRMVLLDSLSIAIIRRN